jgi:hypothetical protein
MNPRMPSSAAALPLAAVALLSSILLLQAQPRVWTSADGRQLTGELIRWDDQSVVVRRNDGRVVTIPRTLLNEADQEFLASKNPDNQPAPADHPKPKGQIRYKLSDGSENWPEDRKAAITAAMDAAVEFYNIHGDFKKDLTANNSPGTPTADANYSGWINWGGSINRRVALHEISHTLGIGTHENWQKNIKDGRWTGKHGLAQLREFDGEEAVLNADRMHFWPYGLNYDNESDEVKDVRHVKMVAAMRKDMGLR